MQRSLQALNRFPSKPSAMTWRRPVLTSQRDTQRPPPSDPSHAIRDPLASNIRPLDLWLSGAKTVVDPVFGSNRMIMPLSSPKGISEKYIEPSGAAATPSVSPPLMGAERV